MRGGTFSAATGSADGQPCEGEGAAESAPGSPCCPRCVVRPPSHVELERAGRLRQVTAGG